MTIVSFVMLSLLLQAQELLLEVGGQKVTVEEFLYYYQKNSVNQASGDITPIDDYMQMFIDFKLKVAEAKWEKLDTVSAFQKELAHYTKQLSKPYLVDQQEVDRLVREAYERKLQEVHASHILVRLPEYATPEDTLYAYRKIQKIRQRVMREPFAQVAMGTSEDPSVKRNGGDLGYFTSLQMVYDFENVAYQLKPGQISEPVRTAFGYHLIKCHGTRKNVGRVKVAHIMLLTPKGLSSDELQLKKQRIQELYHELMSGKNFSSVAKKFSEDKGTAANGGILPWFGQGDMVPEFEKAAFALNEDGALSKPVKTSYGWHIIKRIEREQPGTFAQERTKIEQQVLRSQRVQVAVDSLVAKLLRKDQAIVHPERLAYFYEPTIANVGMADTLLFYKGIAFRIDDFQIYLRENLPHDSLMVNSVLVADKFNTFVQEKVLRQRNRELEKAYPEYGYLVKEYHDGLLLFELMDRRIWGKTMKDTADLYAYYQQHNAVYMWPERFEGRVYECQSAAVCEKVKKAQRGGLFSAGLKDEELLTHFNKDENMLTITSGTFSKGENGYIDAFIWGDKKIPGYIFIRGNKIKPQPKEFSQVKGQVTADYQKELEEEMKKTLRNKFKVIIHEEIWEKTKSTFQ